MNSRDLLKQVQIYYVAIIEKLTKIKMKHRNKTKIPNLSKQCFIGIGGGGTNIIEDISKIDSKHKYIHVNSDYQALKTKTSEYKVLLGEYREDVLGCGGKEQCGLMLVDDNVKGKLHDLTKDVTNINVISTLGGGVGNGAAPEIVKYLQSLNKKVSLFVIMPFSFEGRKRYANAYDAYSKMKNYAVKIVMLENDDLLDISRKNSLGMREAFKMTSSTIYKKVLCSAA